MIKVTRMHIVGYQAVLLSQRLEANTRKNLDPADALKRQILFGYDTAVAAGAAKLTGTVFSFLETGRAPELNKLKALFPEASQLAGPASFQGQAGLLYTTPIRLVKGGMGDVYLGHNPITGWVVIKSLQSDNPPSSEKQARFAREAHLAVLDHRGIVTLRDYKLEGSVPFIAFEVAQGVTLNRYARGQAAPLHQFPRLVAVIIRRVLEVLADLEQFGIVHRDIKPENIIICTEAAPDRPPVRLLDFGIAVLHDVNPRLTQPGQVFGTIGYMPPEILQRGASTATPKADIFSVGVTMIEIFAPDWELCGEFRQCCEQAHKPDYRMLSEGLNKVPPLLRGLAEEMTRSDPEARISSLQAIARLDRLI